MAIKIGNAQTQPALTYDHVFMCRLIVTQQPIDTDGEAPRYGVDIEYRLYALDADGNRHYQTRSNTVSVEDFYALAMGKAQAGDMDLVNAMQAIEAAVAKIIEDQTALTGVTTI